MKGSVKHGCQMEVMMDLARMKQVLRAAMERDDWDRVITVAGLCKAINVKLKNLQGGK
jgi:hypothetical protein